MGNLFSKYWIPNFYGTTIGNEEESATHHASSSTTAIERTPPANSQSDSPESKPCFETSQKSVVKNRSKIYAAFVPDSPERYSFNDFNELKTFLNSPIGKKKGTRFKPCENERELDIFYNEQLTVSTCTDGNTSSSSIEPDLPYKEIPCTRLTEFRIAIEKQDHAKFDELISENPRFLVNTSNDLPTIVHIGSRFNALHIACRSSNLLAVQKILRLITDKSWLTNAYATDTCVLERSSNLLDAMLNTPDKGRNDTPLHFACKSSCAPIVETLLNYRICNREPINRDNEKPLDVLGNSAKGSKQALKEANNKIICAFRKEPSI